MVHLGQQLVVGVALASLLCSVLVLIIVSAANLTWDKVLLSRKRDVLIGSRLVVSE